MAVATRTADSVYANCMAQPGSLAGDCHAVVNDFMIDGVFCDGNVVLDESGKHCIPQATLDAKAAAEADDFGRQLLAKNNAAAAVSALPSWLGWALLATGVVGLALPRGLRAPVVVASTVIGGALLLSKT